MLKRSAVGLLIALLFSCPVWPQTEPASSPPLTIAEAVRTALSNNLSILAAREQVSAARARISGARADRLPDIRASVQYTHLSSIPSFQIPEVLPVPITVNAKDNTVGTVATTQEVYTGGRIPAQITRAEALYNAALARLGITENQINLQAGGAFYNVLLNQSLVTSAEQNLVAAQNQLEAATARFEAGTAARFDVLRAQTQVSEAEQNLVEVRNQVEIARVELNRIMGVPLNQSFGLVQPAPAPFPTESLTFFITTAESLRPEIFAAHSQLAAAEAGIRLAKSDRLPQLNLAANYQVVARETPVQTTGWTFIALASVEIFDGGRIRANINEAESLRDEARINLVDTVRAVEQDVRQTYLNLQTALQTIETARARLAQAQEAYDVAVVRYESGVGTASELADALAALVDARTNLDQARFNYDTAYALLQIAVGLGAEGL